MKTEREKFTLFFEKYSQRIKKARYKEVSFKDLIKYPIMPSQAIYVTDMRDRKVIYQRGIERLLGYSKAEFTFDLLMHYYHPEDIKRYRYIVEKANSLIHQNKPDPFSIEATYDYRLKKKNGSYLKVLRQSTVFGVTEDNLMKSSFSVLSDISAIKTDTSVNLSIVDMESGRILLDDKLENIILVNFTKREKEILLKIKEGSSSLSIAEELNCSRHTVDKHRRNMLQKTRCKNTLELINYSIRYGII